MTLAKAEMSLDPRQDMAGRHPADLVLRGIAVLPDVDRPVLVPVEHDVVEGDAQRVLDLGLNVLQQRRIRVVDNRVVVGVFDGQ